MRFGAARVVATLLVPARRHRLAMKRAHGRFVLSNDRAVSKLGKPEWIARARVGKADRLGRVAAAK